MKWGKKVGFMKNLKTVTIETDRLILRKPKLTDAKDMFTNWASDKEVTKYLSWYPHETVSVTELIIQMWITNDDKDDSIDWIIELKEIKQVIGSINLFNIDLKKKQGEIGYCLSRKYWNQGLMTEAMKKVFEYAFNIGFKVIYGRHIQDNIASGKVMTKSHMRMDQVIEAIWRKNNEKTAFAYYHINKHDWKKLYKSRRC
jgi:RimJ/RimL family protein N-acetyltransferase